MLQFYLHKINWMETDPEKEVPDLSESLLPPRVFWSNDRCIRAGRAGEVSWADGAINWQIEAQLSDCNLPQIDVPRGETLLHVQQCLFVHMIFLKKIRDRSVVLC